MLLDVVACCCAKFETDQTFQPTTPNISFVPWSPKRSATMLDPFAQLFQHCWGHARSLRMDYKDLWVVFFPRCTAGPNPVGSCCIRLHTTANTHATTPNIVGATMFNNVESCCVRLHAALKSKFALLQTLSRLFHLVYFVKCWQMLLKLNSKGLYQSSGKEKERWFFRGNTTLVWAFTAFNKDVGKIHQSRTSYKDKNLMRSVIYWHWSGYSNVV